MNTAKQAKELEEKEWQRYLVLKLVYEVSRCNKNVIIDEEFLADKAGLPLDATRLVCDYLVDESLLRRQGMDSVGIDHQGIVEYEQSLKDPDRPTEHFRAVVIQQLSQTFNGPVGVVQLGDGSTATTAQIARAQHFDAAACFLPLWSASLSLQGEPRRAFQQLLAELHEVLVSEEPKPSELRERLVRLRQAASGSSPIVQKVTDLALKLRCPLAPLE